MHPRGEEKENVEGRVNQLWRHPRGPDGGLGRGFKTKGGQGSVMATCDIVEGRALETANELNWALKRFTPSVDERRGEFSGIIGKMPCEVCSP